MVTVGAGKYTYEPVADWAKLPEGWTLGQTAIVTDSEDRVYLFNRSDHPLIVLDRDGNFLSSWGEGVLTDAHGMYIDADNNLYMPVKNSHVVLKYDPQGNLLMTLGSWDTPSDTGWSGNYEDVVQRAAGPFHRPSDVALSPGGDMYISDGYGNARVHKFTADGSLEFSWGLQESPAQASSTFPTAYGCTPTAGSSSLTGRTTEFKYSPRRAAFSPNGPA